MTQIRFNDFAEIIDIAQQNKISRDAKLILVGRISYALELGELTFAEAQQLEDQLGGRQQWQEAYEMALSGETENSLYQLPA
jgi:hypothetical protein